jgi:L-2-hydroxyglutarate oxidase LhgO
VSKVVQKIDVAIVGGGIVGLWSAYFILKKFKHLSVAVFEAENYLGEHTTGRNSEVLHSGIYYSTHSLKYLHCLRGNQMWRDYVLKKNLSFLDCGKVIVSSRSQADKLDSLYAQAQKNNIQGIRKLSQVEIATLGESVNLDDGFFCPTSGVLNVSEAIFAIKQDVENMGGIILTRNRVQLLEHADENFLLEVNGDYIQATTLVNAGGLFAVDFRKSLSLLDYENYYVKGNYLNLQKKIKSEHLIYPIPPDNGLGLGVHLTLDTSGAQKIGPDTEEVTKINYAVDEKLIGKMLPAIQAVFKNIEEKNLSLAYSGIRPKVKCSNNLVTDFIFNTASEHKIKGYFEFLGIESPGITASISLAEMLSMKL